MEERRPRRSALGTWARHVLLGVPLAAALHTAVQTAADLLSYGALLTVMHFVLGVLFGSIILVPTFSVQALVAIALGKAGAGRWIQVPAGAVVQGSFVSLWALFVGVETVPSRFPITLPLIGAGLVAGAVVAALAAHPQSER